MKDFIKKLRKFVSKLPDRVLRIGLTVLGVLTLFTIFDIETLKKIELLDISNLANTVDNFFSPFCGIFKINIIKITIYTLFVVLIFLRVCKFAMRSKAIVIKHSTFSNALSTYDESNLSGYSVKEIDINLVDQMNNHDIINAISIQDDVIKRILKECDEFTEIFYYGIAHIPLIFRAGFQIGDEGKIHLLHKYRNEQSKFKEILNDSDNFILQLQGRSTNNSFSTSKEMLVVVATSLPVSNEDLIVFRKNDLCCELHFEMENESLYGFDAIDSYAIMNRLRSGILNKIREIVFSKSIERIHLVLATSSDFTFFLAQGFSEHHDPEIIVYQYERSSAEKYPWGISNKLPPESAVIYQPIYENVD